MPLGQIVRLDALVPDGGLPRAQAPVRPRGVRRDAVEPVPERALAPEASQAAERAHERLLGQVVRVGAVGGQRQGEVEDSRLVTADERVDRLRIACLRRRYERLIRVHAPLHAPLHVRLPAGFDRDPEAPPPGSRSGND